MLASTIADVTYKAGRSGDLVFVQVGRALEQDGAMAKPLAARVAGSNADAGVQIHVGNGYALECEASRILCDARILDIFEGAAEI